MGYVTSVELFMNLKARIYEVWVGCAQQNVPAKTKKPFPELFVTQPLVPKLFSGNLITIVAELLAEP